MSIQTSLTRSPELLSPAGDWEAMRAAVANGADAVYFGLSDFNARHRAANFSVEELPEIIRYLHGRNVRGYVTFNTLVFSNELPKAAEFLRAIAQAGADAVIVQDLGVARLVRRLAPGLAIHGSTQMTLTEPRGIEFVRQLGVERVILARELSLHEIRKISENTPMPLEVFVHGALCVSYSGQCLTSESVGGRSANRGQCAQACRLPYDMIVDGQPRDLGDRAYLLSPQDLAAHDLIGDLVPLGVCCFKIEGRLKSAQYVAGTTQTYRAALDAALAQRPFRLTRQQELELAQSFSRGLTHGFLDGVDHQKLVQGRFPKNRGVRVGTVVKKSVQGVIVALDPPCKIGGQEGEGFGGRAGESPTQGVSAAPGGPQPHALINLIKPGDGVVFDEGHPEQDEQGGRVFTARPLMRHALPAAPSTRPSRGGSLPVDSAAARPIFPEQELVEITFGRGDVNLAAVSIGSIVWKTDDPALRRRLERSYTADRVARRIPLRVRVRACVGQRLQITALDPSGSEIQVRWERPLELAEKHPLTVELIREHFGRLGPTRFELAAVEVDQLDPVMVPKSVLNDLRRQAVQALTQRLERETLDEKLEPDALERIRSEIRLRPAAARHPGDAAGEAMRPPATLESPRDELYALVRTMEQFHAVMDWSPQFFHKPAMVYCDFQDVRLYKEAVRLSRSAGLPIALSTLRVLKPGEEGLLHQILECGPDGVLVRNLAGLSFFREHAPGLPLIGDYSLNVANEITADLLANHGLVRLVPSYDLNWKQLAGMLEWIDPGLFETVLHQHMPMFHMEHCVFAAFLSKGRDYRDCGRPCDRHRVDLRDRAGADNPVVADIGCRNTVYNVVAQSASEYVPAMKKLGIRSFRVELLLETQDQTRSLLDSYARLLAGHQDGERTWRQLRVLNQFGVTRGTLVKD